MKRIITLIIVSLIFFSCEKLYSGEGFEGIWYIKVPIFAPLDDFLIIKNMGDKFVILETGSSFEYDGITLIRGLGKLSNEHELHFTTEFGIEMIARYFINSIGEEVLYLDLVDSNNEMDSGWEYYRFDDVTKLERVLQK